MFDPMLGRWIYNSPMLHKVCRKGAHFLCSTSIINCHIGISFLALNDAILICVCFFLVSVFLAYF